MERLIAAFQLALTYAQMKGTMEISSDFADLLRAFNAEEARYLVIGALANFGAPLDRLSAADLTSDDRLYDGRDSAAAGRDKDWIDVRRLERARDRT